MQAGVPSTLWAHRVNTLGKMRDVANIFAGVEIDVVYDEQERVLFVNHPPDPPSGLKLDSLLRYANRLDRKLGLWLDVKNLNEENAAALLHALRRLDATHAIRDRAIVETDHVGPAAERIREAGFLTSYYLPTALVTRQAAATETTCNGATGVQHSVAAHRFAAVSYDWRGHRWVERCLGAFVRKQALRRYAWDLSTPFSDRAAGEALNAERLQSYAGLSAILVPFHSMFDDRR